MWRVVGCVAVMLTAGSAIAQPETLPGDDPAAWLEEASVQARRVSGVGEELTAALQSKGELLAHIAAWQRAVGADSAADESERIVRLCIRALAHDGEDGWIRTAQAWAAHDLQQPELVASYLESIENPTERAYAESVITQASSGVELDREQMSEGFRAALERLSAFDWARDHAFIVADSGSMRDAQVWVAAFEEPAERAWASLGVAQSLHFKALRNETEATLEAADPELKSVEQETAAPQRVSEADGGNAPESSPMPSATVASLSSVDESPAAGRGPDPAVWVRLAASAEPITTRVVDDAVTPIHAPADAEGPVLTNVEPAPPAPTPASPVVPAVPSLTLLADPAALLDDTPAPAAYDVRFTTTKGGFTVRVHRGWAPRAADRFEDLVAAGFYQNQRFFRVVPGFVVQWGIHGFPDVAKAWRSQRFPDEPRLQSNRRGTIAFAAATTPNTRTTQVFINLADNAFLDELGFVPFGEIIDGLDVVESLFGGYGETPSERQRDIQLQGNAFLDTQYPELDSIISVEIVPGD